MHKFVLLKYNEYGSNHDILPRIYHIHTRTLIYTQKNQHTMILS